MHRWLQMETVLVLFAVLAVLLFPVPRGPYSATHGPAATLRAICASISSRLSTACSTLRNRFGFGNPGVARFACAHVPVSFALLTSSSPLRI